MDDALRICLLLRDAKPEAYERAVVRWLGRFCLERPSTTLADVLDAVKAFERMPAQPEGSKRLLRQPGGPDGLTRAGRDERLNSPCST
ncbi:MAG TPA: hypothetical protein VFQ12_11745 [Thermoleophilaceae bacterium]|nr:hypothetical protein [Thermoleophilaceae bacterium]